MDDLTHITRMDDTSHMWADAVLPADIRPETVDTVDSPQVALLTGACGFLGRYVARELLNHSDLRLVCLVREKIDETPKARVARIFADMDVSQEVLNLRVEVLVGDLTEPRLGLDADSYADLVGQVDAIYHCAALVDWVHNYRHLYRMNVGGVLALIRLACEGQAKRLVFASSVAVCYVTDGPERIDEDTDMLPFVGGMPLGYARSKCVAEALLRQAADRGVMVTVLRPSLIAGDSVTGTSNPTDMIAALVQGCVATGMASDVDWLLDCVPVDFVARVMTQVPQGASAWKVLNLMHQHPRYWRELILWMNLHGYPIKLVDADEWVQHLFDKRHARGTMLDSQRQFFRGVQPRAGAGRPPRPYEMYLATAQVRIDASRTRALLIELGLHEASLDADLLHAYFDDYRRAGVLPPRGRHEERSLTLDGLLGGSWLPPSFNVEAHRWVEAERTRIGADDGLLSEIATASFKDSVGLIRLHARDGLATQPALAVLKAKVSDKLLQALIVAMAQVCRPKLGLLFGQFRDDLGLTRSHERELALYELDEPGLRRHMPACYGTLRNPDAGRWAMLLEYLPEVNDRKGQPPLRADDTGMGAVLNGLLEIHAPWYRLEDKLAALPWLVAPPSPARMLEMTPFWLELADFAAPSFEAWCGPYVRDLQAKIIGGLSDWWPRLRGASLTLIHNDFNPRNLVLRERNEQPRLCVYDWELATVGAPQHDLAELLCFTWHNDMNESDLIQLLESYRAALSSVSGYKIDPIEWREGFDLALNHLFINRFALYTLMHRFRPLDYLPRVMANWIRLYAWTGNSRGCITDE
ncbi:MAG: NAD-dependent epimerase/dehydratase family protein [Propionibacteriaceae bacterium]|nr:NAD-dependent epimerase/dehydratase family protein [Propionibacteriaceae bacterium]